MKQLLSSAVFFALVMVATAGARAQTQVTLVAPGDLRAPITQLIPRFERKTGIQVKATFGSGGGTKREVAQGAPFDVPIVQPPYQNVLASGNVVVGSATPLASVAVGVAVREGAPKPDISTPAAVKRMLLAAKSIAFPNPARGATAGVSFERTLRKLGIYKQVQAKLKPARGGAGAMQMVARGEVEIGLTFLSEMNEPGIEIVGPLPAAISTRTRLVGFVSAHTKNPAAAKTLLEYLASPEAAPVYREHGMQPGR